MCDDVRDGRQEDVKVFIKKRGGNGIKFTRFGRCTVDYLLAPDKDNFLSKALVFHRFLVFHHIGENISLDLFYFVNLTSSCSLIPQKKNVFFHIHEIMNVVVLYTSLRLVEGVYKPQQACVG